jgi:hypothetical protein
MRGKDEGRRMKDERETEFTGQEPVGSHPPFLPPGSRLLDSVFILHPSSFIL